MNRKDLQILFAAGGMLAAVVLWLWHRSSAVQVSSQNTAGYSSDAALGNIVTNSSYQGATGAVETYTNNQRYSDYLKYINSRQNQNQSFNIYEQQQWLNRTQSMPLPYNT